MLTLAKLRRFAKTRNKSGFNSNLQFQIDAEACGMRVADLGDCRKFIIDGSFAGYEWRPTTKEGCVRVIEFGRTLYIGDDDDPDTKSMLDLMKKAEFAPEKDVA